MELRYHTLLGPAELSALGVPAGWPIGLANRVQFDEIDALNHVNNTIYLRWFESFRLPYMAEYGISDYREGDPKLVLRSVSARFHREMFVGEDYIVTGRTASFRRTSFRMEYAVFADGLAAEGDAVIVLLDPAGGGRHPLSSEQKRRFAERDGAADELA